jgi:hypothetical protein
MPKGYGRSATFSLVPPADDTARAQDKGEQE